MSRPRPLSELQLAGYKTFSLVPWTRYACRSDPRYSTDQAKVQPASWNLFSSESRTRSVVPCVTLNMSYVSALQNIVARGKTGHYFGRCSGTEYSTNVVPLQLVVRTWTSARTNSCVSSAVRTCRAATRASVPRASTSTTTGTSASVSEFSTSARVERDHCNAIFVLLSFGRFWEIRFSVLAVCSIPVCFFNAICWDAVCLKIKIPGVFIVSL